MKEIFAMLAFVAVLVMIKEQLKTFIENERFNKKIRVVWL